MLKVQIKTNCRCNCCKQSEAKRYRQKGGASIRKPERLCVRGTHPWCALKAHHYRGSQMIGLVKTTGWAARLQRPETTWLGTNSRQGKRNGQLVLFFSSSSLLHLKQGTFPRRQLVQTCSQSLPSKLQQVKVNMPAGYSQEYARHVYTALVSWLNQPK